MLLNAKKITLAEVISSVDFSTCACMNQIHTAILFRNKYNATIQPLNIF